MNQEEKQEKNKFDFKRLIKLYINKLILYVDGDGLTSKQAWFFEKFTLRHAVLGSSIVDHINYKPNIRGIIKQIISNVLCWIFACKLIIDLIIFTKVEDKTIINYDGYFGNAFGKDKVSITIFCAILMGMFSSFQTVGK